MARWSYSCISCTNQFRKLKISIHPSPDEKPSEHFFLRRIQIRNRKIPHRKVIINARVHDGKWVCAFVQLVEISSNLPLADISSADAWTSRWRTESPTQFDRYFIVPILSSFRCNHVLLNKYITIMALAISKKRKVINDINVFSKCKRAAGSHC